MSDVAVKFEVTAPLAESVAPMLIAGASLVPVIVTVTVCVAVPLWPSLTVIAKLSVLVWPKASCAAIVSLTW